ncbi:hypothetical protein N658DRAFT_239751 [Parathielavia hyrcaniae]|uniref:Uncharacterized protein n=1 Tax=Parathielavia hyrcaniae TaxID=113614 RepID=A0AAN6T3R8_9PEZI|nr:hypothetical protein N658DRAFT_239751 [Parathielavia hyrcaniae]
MESLVPAEISASEVLWPAVNNKRKRDETETADEAGARLLTTGSQWPLALSTTDIRGLAEIWAAGDFHRKTSEFVPTARDVAVTAMASVDFVQSLEGGTVHASSIGIDHAGRLFQKPKNFVGEDFWEDFCEMVNELREKSLQLTVKDRIVTLIGIFLEFKSDYDRLNNSESKYALLCLFKVVEGLKKGDGVQSTGRLEEVHDECQKVCEVLNKVISAIDVVQQDLIDTGSTSLQRWNRSRKIQGAFAVDQPLSDLCTYVVKLRFYMEPYQRFLGATSQLRDCLA